MLCRCLKHVFFRGLGLCGIALAGTWDSASLRAEAPSYMIRNWQTEAGLPQDTVTALAATSDGYLWLGTYNGLARFDGLNFTVFAADKIPELENGRISSLYADTRGRLWIGHETGDVTWYQAGRFHSIKVEKRPPPRSVMSISEDEYGLIWLLAPDGALRRIGTDFQVSLIPSRVGGTTLSLRRDCEGRLWSLRMSELSQIRKGRPTPILGGLGTNRFLLEAGCARRAGGLWLLMDRKIMKWVDGKTSEVIGVVPRDLRQVSAMAETVSGELAFGTLDRGLFLLAPTGEVAQFSRSNGLADDWVRSLYADAGGNLWVGTANGGLNMLQRKTISEIAPPDGWQGRQVLSVCASRNGSLWVGTEGAGLYHFRDGNWEHFGPGDGISNPYVWSVLEDSSGQLWVGTWNGGLLIKRDDRFELLSVLRGLPGPMTALYQDETGKRWVGSGSGLASFDQNQFTKIGKEADQTAGEVRAITRDSEGRIWFGMSGGGLGCIMNGTVKQFRKQDGLSSDLVQCLRAEPDGTLWVGTYGGGLTRRRQERFATVGTRQGLPSNVILGVADDGKGNYLMSSLAGILMMGKEALNRCADGQLDRVRCFVYGKNEGMPTLECSGGFQPVTATTPDGRIWFPTRKGLVGISPEGSTNSLPPRVLIEEVLFDGRSVAFPTNEAPLSIRSGKGQLTFRYTGLDYTAPEEVRFRYRLEGLDPSWVEADARRDVAYGYLPPGHYTFCVTACNKGGLWTTTPACLALDVLPQFWQTWWFKLLVAVSGVAAVAGAVLYGAHQQMRKKLRRLEQQQALERERARIARDIHDHLGSSLTHITMLSQLAQEEHKHSEPYSNLRQIYQTADDLTRAMDEIVWAVNPKNDSLDNLMTYLGSFAQRFLGSVGIACRLELPMHLPPKPLTSELRHNVFLAFKEALNNAAKHSGATEVRISLVDDDHNSTLTVIDNGRGFDLGAPAENARGGNGLSNMRLRMKHINGQCEITTAPGTGTKVRFMFQTSFNQN